MSGTALIADTATLNTRPVALWALLLIGALYVVGVESHGIVRHIVQTAPVWPAVVLALRRSPWSKWTALPCFLFWLSLMALIWLFLLGWAHVFTGDFTPIEIVLTLIIGVSCIAGIIAAIRIKTDIGAMGASAAFFGILIVQWLSLRISFLPAIARDHWR